jgi:hypothetical protein
MILINATQAVMAFAIEWTALANLMSNYQVALSDFK